LIHPDVQPVRNLKFRPFYIGRIHKRKRWSFLLVPCTKWRRKNEAKRKVFLTDRSNPFLPKKVFRLCKIESNQSWSQSGKQRVFLDEYLLKFFKLRSFVSYTKKARKFKNKHRVAEKMKKESMFRYFNFVSDFQSLFLIAFFFSLFDTRQNLKFRRQDGNW